MPVYSFQCNDCGHKFDRFFFRIGQKENTLCPRCKSNHTTKQISTTNTHSTEKKPTATRCLPKFGFG
jgi:putative FmdB family regulatory protein